MSHAVRLPCDEAAIRSGPPAAVSEPSAGPWVLAATILGSSLAFIDGTVVSVALPAIAAEFGAVGADLQWVVEAYALTAMRHGGRLPAAHERAQAVAVTIERALSEQPAVLCHNDLLNANFIDDGVSIRIVDWEYAGMGDRFFDFGNFAVNHQLTEDDEAALLMAYFGRVAAAQHARLRLMRLMSDYREAMWGVLQQAISELDFDFAGYAAKHFDRLLAGAADPHFPDWLEQAGA